VAEGHEPRVLALGGGLAADDLRLEAVLGRLLGPGGDGAPGQGDRAEARGETGARPDQVLPLELHCEPFGVDTKDRLARLAGKYPDRPGTPPDPARASARIGR